MAGFDPLQTLQAMQHQQALQGQQYLAQSKEREAMRIEGDLQAKEAQRIQVMQQGMENMERQSKQKQQEFDNGILLMEKEAELSERLGRDIRGELGKWTTRSGEGAVTGDQPQRREQVARAGVQAEEKTRLHAEDTQRERASQQFGQREQSREAAALEYNRRLELRQGTADERAQKRSSIQKGREARNTATEQRTAQSEASEPLKQQRRRQLIAKGANPTSTVSGSQRALRGGVKGAFQAKIEALQSHYKRQSAALIMQSSGKAGAGGKWRGIQSQAKAVEKAGQAAVDSLQGPMKRVLGIIEDHKKGDLRQLTKALIAYGRTVENEEANALIEEYVQTLLTQLEQSGETL